MKPRKIQVFDYYDPRGPAGELWKYGDRCTPPKGEYALLCDSEAHAGRILGTLVALTELRIAAREALRGGEHDGPCDGDGACERHWETAHARKNRLRDALDALDARIESDRK